MFKEYAEHDATGLAELVARRAVSPAELLEAALARAAAVNPRIAALCTPMTEIGRRRAREALFGPFAGVPFLLKDIAQDYAGVPTTSGSRALRHWTPTEHAEIVRRFLHAGLVIFGKTSTPEFALKAQTEPALFGPTRNPWDLSRTPGGSSGGSAAAVAAGIVPMAGASDGGGSIRIPASYCGLFGLRPSRGRVSPGPLHGEFWDGASSEHVLTRSVRDSARLLDAIAGSDAGAPFAIASPERPFAAALECDPPPLKIAFCTRSPIGTAVHPECIAAVEKAVALLRELGHQLEEGEPPIDGHELARCFLYMYFGHVAANIAETQALTDAADSDFELETRALGMLGRALSAGDFVSARKRWNHFARGLGGFFGRFDLYLTPSVAMPPAKIGEGELPRAQQLALRLLLRANAGTLLLKSGVVDQMARQSLARVPFTQLSNLTGTPSMSVPLHWAALGEGGPELPFGAQFVAPMGQEWRLLSLAAQLERASPWISRRPEAV